MRGKELRLALVFFGGVSLAVYEHGINRELLNLVRASKLYHSDGQGADTRFNSSYPDEPEQSTGDVYLQFLKKIGEQTPLRVIIDVISGSSAGGVNGIALARALAHDLSLAALTDVWLEEADMFKLLAPEARASAWSKWYFLPFVNPFLEHLNREGLLPGNIDAEMQKQISVFLRSRWFKPPLDGRRLTKLFFESLEAMEMGGSTTSLLPPGTKLDLLVTVTDFRGLDRQIFIHDPPAVQELEHRLLLRFNLDHPMTGHLRSDFGLDSVPSLAFAARASASFPGAFPPARLGEIDDFLASIHRPWPTRALFLDNNFSRYREQKRSPEEAILIDGSILNNRPITATLDMIRSHTAFRDVDRRLVYIDPHSAADKPVAPKAVPGFFSTLRGALSDLPRNDPIYNELAAISGYNKQTRRLKETIVGAKSDVTELIEHATDGKISGIYTTSDLRHWRLGSTTLLASSPIVYNSWMRSLVFEALDFLAGLISEACDFPEDSTAAYWTQEIIEQWARNRDIITVSYFIPADVHENEQLGEFAKFIVRFGLVYKRRRLNFVLSEINTLRENLSADSSTDSENLDLIKLKLHKLIDETAIYDSADFLSTEAVAQCRKLFSANVHETDVTAFIRQNEELLSSTINRIASEADIDRLNDSADTVLSSELMFRLQTHCRRAILTSYLGYFYWDILLRPAASALSLETGPIEEIRIDRISPDDATSLRPMDAAPMLLGGSLGGFGGFLSRVARENDYVWGRLHAIDRLVDILASTVPAVCSAEDIKHLKTIACEMVVEEESRQQRINPELMAQLKTAIDALQH